MIGIISRSRTIIANPNTLVYATTGKVSLILSVRNEAKTTSTRLMQTLTLLESLLGQKLMMLMITSMHRGV